MGGVPVRHMCGFDNTFFSENKRFSVEDTQMAHRHMEICLTSLIIKEMQIATTMRYHLIPVRIAVLKKTRNKQVGKDVEKTEPSTLLVGM